MNWSLGLFRLWLLVSGLWAVLNVAPVWNECAPLGGALSQCAVSVAVAVGGPVAVLLLGLVLAWVVRGFCRDDSQWWSLF